MNNQNTRYPKRQSGISVSSEQEAIIRIYADRVGEKIGRLVSEIIIDSLTLLWAEKPISQLSVIREQSVSDKLLNAAEVAKRLGISKSQAYLLMQREEIPTVRLRRSVRVRPQDLEEFINRRNK